MANQKVFLVPGFLGYDSLGGFAYFADRLSAALRGTLEQSLGRRVEVIPLRTRPTGSLAARQQALLDQLARHATAGDALHLVGHSTGGVDSHLLLDARPRVPSWAPYREVRRRIASVTTLAAPHWGTCLAERTAPLFGLKRALERPPDQANRTPATDRARSDARRLLAEDLDQGGSPLGGSDLADLAMSMLLSPRAALRFLHKLVSCHPAVEELRPDAMREVRAGFVRDEDIDARVACVVTVAPAPAPFNDGLLDGAIYNVAHRLTAAPGRLPAWAPRPEALAGVEVIGDDETARPPIDDLTANDGVVNTLLQLLPEDDRTRTEALVVADHMDVLGYYHRTLPGGSIRHGQLDSRSRFDDDEFFALYRRVARFIAAAAG